MTSQTHISRADEAELATAGAVRAVEFVPLVLICLLLCPPLAILAVVVVVPLLAIGLVLALAAAIVTPPYLLVEHLRGRRGHVHVMKHRLRHAGRAVWDLAPHRIAAGARAR
jgi:hypothetical protein